MAMLRLNIILIFVCGLIGCSTTKIDWEEARSINTANSYLSFLKKHPNTEFSEQAQEKLEAYNYESATENGTVIGYSSYLLKTPHGIHVKDVKNRIKEIRCQDHSLSRIFPSWLKKGQPNDPERRSSWLLANSYIAVEPSDIGRGYKAAGDDPDYPLELVWGASFLVYYSGRGVIVGPDGKNILVGYDCK